MIVAGAILLVMSSLYRKQCEKKPVSAVPWEPVLRPWSLSNRILWTPNAQLYQRRRNWRRRIVVGTAGLLIAVGLWSAFLPKFAFMSFAQRKETVKVNSVTFVVPSSTRLGVEAELDELLFGESAGLTKSKRSERH